MSTRPPNRCANRTAIDRSAVKMRNFFRQKNKISPVSAVADESELGDGRKTSYNVRPGRIHFDGRARFEQPSAARGNFGFTVRDRHCSVRTTFFCHRSRILRSRLQQSAERRPPSDYCCVPQAVDKSQTQFRLRPGSTCPMVTFVRPPSRFVRGSRSTPRQ